MPKKSFPAVFILLIILLLAGCNYFGGVGGTDIPPAPPMSQNEIADKGGEEPGGEEDREPARPTAPEAQDPTAAEPEPKISAPAAGPPEAPEPAPAPAQAHLIVTRDFGGKTIFAQWTPVTPGQDALSLTSNYVEVETAYGGSFINAIDGLASGYTGNSGNKEKYDWFFYFNGVLSGRGAADIKAGPGDTIWWDYHDWASSAFTPAMIGAFPQPFSNGVLLAYSPAARDAATMLAAGLESRGINKVELREVSDEVIEKRATPVIMLGLRPEIMELDYVKALNANPSRIGVFCSFSDSGIKLFNTAMREERVLQGEGCACLGATASGMGDANPLWFLVGEDESGLERAVSYLNQGDISSDCAWGVAFDPQGPISLPLR